MVIKFLILCFSILEFPFDSSLEMLFSLLFSIQYEYTALYFIEHSFKECFKILVSYF